MHELDHVRLKALGVVAIDNLAGACVAALRTTGIPYSTALIVLLNTWTSGWRCWRRRWWWWRRWIRRIIPSYGYVWALAIDLIGRLPCIPTPVEKAVVSYIPTRKPCNERVYPLSLLQEAPSIALSQRLAVRISIHIQRVGSKALFDFIELAWGRLVARREEPVVHRGIGTDAKLMPTTVGSVPVYCNVDQAPFGVGVRGFQSIISMLGRLGVSATRTSNVWLSTRNAGRTAWVSRRLTRDANTVGARVDLATLRGLGHTCMCVHTCGKHGQGGKVSKSCSGRHPFPFWSQWKIKSEQRTELREGDRQATARQQKLYISSPWLPSKRHFKDTSCIWLDTYPFFTISMSKKYLYNFIIFRYWTTKPKIALQHTKRKTKTKKVSRTAQSNTT